MSVQTKSLQLLLPTPQSRLPTRKPGICFSSKCRACFVCSVDKQLWVKSNVKEVLTTALEAGHNTYISWHGDSFDEVKIRSLGQFTPLKLSGECGPGTLGQVLHPQYGCIGYWAVVHSAQEWQAVQQQAATLLATGMLVVDSRAWKVIPAENLVAIQQQRQVDLAPALAAQSSLNLDSSSVGQASPALPTSAGSSATSDMPDLVDGLKGDACRPLPPAFQRGRVLAVASSAVEGKVLLEALESGVQGVVLETKDPVEVRELAAYIKQRATSQRTLLQEAVVTDVRPLGMAHRACVDLCELLRPGEGMLVGNFARCLFLVHSECEDTSYISSRPFRVNAGPVHAYCSAPGGRTAYLSELQSGTSVTVVDAADGRTRDVVVGRVKIEARPMLLVSAQTQDGAQHSVLLQNAETVKLVGRAAKGEVNSGAVGAAGAGTVGWTAISVSSLQAGDSVLVAVQGAARHTGMNVDEFVAER